MTSVVALLRTADEAGFKPKQDFLKKLFKELRKTKVRRPDIVCRYGRQMLSNCSDDVEGWAMHEFVFLSALDIGDDILANRCLQPIVEKFPDSTRAKTLLGHWNEYKGEYEAALTLYAELLAAKPTNLAIMKRKHKLKEAVDELQNIVGTFYSDVQSWLELADVYAALSDYKSASVCLEEVAILQPSSPLVHVRLAELLYTLGAREDLVKSRHHYSISLTLLDPANNLRALYGLIAVCSSLLEENNSGSKKQPAAANDETAVSKELLAWAKERLVDVSSKDKSPTGGVLGFVAGALSPCLSSGETNDDQKLT